MINIILAIEKNGGIGINNELPWHISEELKLFNKKTQDSVLIVGRKTFQKLPNLKNRIVFCISRDTMINSSNNDCVVVFQSIDEAIQQAKNLNKNIFIIGGNQIYNYVFENYKNEILVHISFIDQQYNCDTYFNMNNLRDFYIINESKYELFRHCEMQYQKFGERQYLDLIKNILGNGERRKTRNAETISDFCKHLKFDLRDGFPLLTTKKMFLKGIIEELLFFIRGDTQTKILEEKGINIWKGNTSREFLDANGFEDRKEGEMGPMYGSQWRHFNSIYRWKDKEEEKLIDDDELYQFVDDVQSSTMDEGYNTQLPDFDHDQLKFVINEIKKNPTSRRILMTTFNPGQVDQGVLWPCHSITLQFYVQDKYLDMFCYNRSSDFFHGIPFNITSSSLLLMIIAKLTRLNPRYINISMGDVHIYSEHIDAVEEQIKRKPYNFPNIIIPDIKTLEDVEKLTYEDFKLENYKYHPIIKKAMIA